MNFVFGNHIFEVHKKMYNVVDMYIFTDVLMPIFYLGIFYWLPIAYCAIVYQIQIQSSMHIIWEELENVYLVKSITQFNIDHKSIANSDF